MHEAVSDHLVFALEALPALAPWAAFHGAEVRPRLRVDVGVRAGRSVSLCAGCLQRDGLLEKVLRLERGRRAVWLFTLVSPREALGDVCKTGSNRRRQMPRCHRAINAEHALPTTFNRCLQHVRTVPNRAVVSFDRDRCRSRIHAVGDLRWPSCSSRAEEGEVLFRSEEDIPYTRWITASADWR